MAKFFSADQHIGELPEPGNPSYYRTMPPPVFEQFFLDQCYKKIKSSDHLYLIGDLILELKDLEFYNQLPKCNLHIICGNKEGRIKGFAEEAERILERHFGQLEVLTGVQEVEINGKYWRVAHKPKDLCGFSMPKPAICGHVHSFWRTSKLPDGMPIINVGVDAWGYGLVSEDFLEKQYKETLSGAFDQFIKFWK